MEGEYAMMRVALLSDIHGNLVALDAVLADLALHGPFDQIVVAGDLVWSGPWPAEVVDRVRALGAHVIQGNTDAFFARKANDIPPGKREGRFSEHWSWKRLGPERTAYLANLPFSHRISPAPGQDLLVVHANPFDMERTILPALTDAELDNLLVAPGAAPDWRALAYGHLHVPSERLWRGRLLVDVASAGLPMDGDPRAAYAILTWDGAWHAHGHRVFYDIPEVIHEMLYGGLPRGKHFAERLKAAAYRLPAQPAVVLD
jgi:predicted phosphodiesterase